MVPEKSQRLFWEKVDKSGECWVWTASRDAKGYGCFGVAGKIKRTHRLSFLMHNGEIPSHLIVCHSCDNPSCVNPDHLWLGTHQDNAIDRERKNRGGRKGPEGSKAPHAKLTEAIVAQIKAIIAEGKTTHRSIAKQFGVHFATISDLATGKTWRHV